MNINEKKIAKKIFIKGSRLPISFLIDYLKEGYSISDFISSYPWVKKKDVIDKLEEFNALINSSRYAY